MNETKTTNNETKEQEEIYRFIQDLEFVQCLSNPYYLDFLAKNNYFNDQRFINYLKYLQYFKKLKYMKYITYSRSIVFLDLIQYDFFRELLYYDSFINYLFKIIAEDSFPQLKNQNENNITNKMENMTIDK